MEKLFYVEIICDRTKDYLDDDEKTLRLWKKWVDFEYVGLVEDDLENSEVTEWLSLVHKLYPEKEVIYISDGTRFLYDDTFIDEIILQSPIKICIVLPEEEREIFLKDFAQILKNTKYRFLKSGKNEIEGYHFHLIDREHMVDIELYKHVPTNQKEKIKNQDYLQMLGNKDLFQYTSRRKYMPVLRDGRLFKCRYAYILWNYWETNQCEIEKLSNYKSLHAIYRKIVKKNIFINPEQFTVENHFYEESELCSMCPGCVECVVHQKLNTKFDVDHCCKS